MAPNQLSDKLDHLSEADLGIPFSEAEVWSRLEGRLNRRSRDMWVWWVAAVLLIGMVSIPFSLQDQSLDATWNRDWTSTTDSPSIHPAEMKGNPTPSGEAKVQGTDDRRSTIKMVTLARRKIGIQLAAVQAPSLALAPIEVRNEKIAQPQFAAQDISMIQASLGTRNVEQGRKIAIRAQWQNSSTKSKVEFQALKIKLYEKNE